MTMTIFLQFENGRKTFFSHLSKVWGEIKKKLEGRFHVLKGMRGDNIFFLTYLLNLLWEPKIKVSPTLIMDYPFFCEIPYQYSFL